MATGFPVGASVANTLEDRIDGPLQRLRCLGTSRRLLQMSLECTCKQLHGHAMAPKGSKTDLQKIHNRCWQTTPTNNIQCSAQYGHTATETPAYSVSDPVQQSSEWRDWCRSAQPSHPYRSQKQRCIGFCYESEDRHSASWNSNANVTRSPGTSRMCRLKRHDCKQKTAPVLVVLSVPKILPRWIRATLTKRKLLGKRLLLEMWLIVAQLFSCNVQQLTKQH